MRKYVTTIPAGSSVIIGVVGNFLRLVSAPGPVRFDAIDNQETVELELGDAAELTAFRQLVLSDPAGLGGEVVFYVGNNTKLLSARIGGSVVIESGAVVVESEAPAASVSEYTSAVGTSAVNAFSANSNRRALFVQNLSDTADLWVRFGAAPAVGTGIKLEPGASLLLDKAAPATDVRLIASAAATAVYCASFV